MNKTITTIMLISIWLSVNAFSFKFDVFGYEISYNAEKETQVINNINDEGDVTMKQKSQIQYNQLHEFDELINQVNSYKVIQSLLKELDYTRLGFIDTDTNNHYTIFVGDDGIIQGVYVGLIQPQATLKGSINGITQHIQNGDLVGLKNSVEIPFRVKIRLLLMRFI